MCDGTCGADVALRLPGANNEVYGTIGKRYQPPYRPPLRLRGPVLTCAMLLPGVPTSRWAACADAPCTYALCVYALCIYACAVRCAVLR